MLKIRTGRNRKIRPSCTRPCVMDLDLLNIGEMRFGPVRLRECNVLDGGVEGRDEILRKHPYIYIYRRSEGGKKKEKRIILRSRGVIGTSWGYKTAIYIYKYWRACVDHHNKYGLTTVYARGTYRPPLKSTTAGGEVKVVRRNTIFKRGSLWVRFFDGGEVSGGWLWRGVP